jgi:hypothetical protein
MRMVLPHVSAQRIHTGKERWQPSEKHMQPCGKQHAFIVLALGECSKGQERRCRALSERRVAE